MSDRHETIADIIAEMRKTYVSKGGAGYCGEVWIDLLRYADRLEAAHKRERGDSAKLRNALKQVNELNDLWFDTFTLPDGATSIHDEIENVISAALAEPPRNCDVGTAKEQNTRHSQFCYAQMKRNNHCCGPCPCYKFINGEAQACTLLWAQMPYEEGGAK